MANVWAEFQKLFDKPNLWLGEVSFISATRMGVVYINTSSPVLYIYGDYSDLSVGDKVFIRGKEFVGPAPGIKAENEEIIL